MKIKIKIKAKKGDGSYEMYKALRIHMRIQNDDDHSKFYNVRPVLIRSMANIRTVLRSLVFGGFSGIECFSNMCNSIMIHRRVCNRIFSICEYVKC